MQTLPRIFVLCLMLAGIQSLQAQQQAMYTQYMFNGLALNPAYAGSHESLSLTALARRQWVGFAGAPNSESFASHTPLKNDRIGVGFLLSHDNIGVTHQYNFHLAYAYRIPMGPGKMSFGIQGGFSNYNNALTELYLGPPANPNNTDPNFASNVNSFTPSIGTGLYYFSEKFYIGLSSPQLFNYNTQIDDATYAKQIRHYFLTGGYVFDISNNLKLKPSFLVKGVDGAPLQLDINSHLLIKEVLWTGISYRSLESISTLVQLQVTDQLRFGYSYDLPVRSSFHTTNSGSHEFMLNYSFTFYKSHYVSPRYF